MIDHFSEAVAERLAFYVYRLIDPRTGETFYVGKGRGNRVFMHANEGRVEGEEDATDAKLSRIHSIRNGGFSVGHVIHRHGLTEEAAFEVEAALMDAYPGITNIQGGQGSVDRGVAHADDIVRRYEAPEVVFRHRVVLITVNRSAEEQDLYSAVRYAWKLSLPKAQQAEYVLAVQRGLIRGAYVPEEWMEATAANFPGLYDRPGRFGFRGRPAPAAVWAMYVDHRVPDALRRRGAANPVRYAAPGEPPAA